MDPFVVISFGKKVFRTRVVRHSLNPCWEEKLLFHVRRYESAFKVQLTVLDWDKLSSNDHVGEASFNVSELIANAPQMDERTDLYPAEEDGTHPMQDFVLPLSTAKEMPWETKHNPVLRIRAKYQPYDALRQRFWRQYLKQYDTDDSGCISHVELTSLLDSLGSTLSRETVDSFFTRFGKRPHEDTITINESIQCLEMELSKPASERRVIDSDENVLDTSAPATPAGLNSTLDHQQLSLNFEKLDFSGMSAHENVMPRESLHPDPVRKPAAPLSYATAPMQQTLSESAAGTGMSPAMMSAITSRPVMVRHASGSSSDIEDTYASGSGSAVGSAAGSTSSGSRLEYGSLPSSPPQQEDVFERVINVKNCPLCHRPRLNSKAEMDIVTHLAVCASQDWARVDRIMVGNFVTASQAQRKWYTKVITKVSSGNYKLGAVSILPKVYGSSVISDHVS